MGARGLAGLPGVAWVRRDGAWGWVPACAGMTGWWARTCGCRWVPAGDAGMAGWARLRPRRPLHGHRLGHPRQSRHPRLLPAAARGGQAAQGGPHRLHAQAAHSLQRAVQERDPLGPHLDSLGLANPTQLLRKIRMRTAKWGFGGIERVGCREVGVARCAGVDRGAGSRPGSWSGAGSSRGCGSTRSSSDSRPAHHERGWAGVWLPGRGRLETGPYARIGEATRRD